MKIEIDTVKGFQDYLPPISQKRQAVKAVIEKYFRLYGFLPVETPAVEFDELMKADILPNEEEDEAVSDRFRLKDRAGRNLGLRYEFTFQLARIMRQNPTMKLPFRRYQIGEVFRDEPVSANRFRQFIQCDADIIGEPSIDADAECLALISDILKELKIDAEIHVNNRKLLQGIIESVQIPAVKQVMRELDKIDKIGEDNLKANLRKYANANQILTLFKLLEKDLRFFKDNAFDGAAELEELMAKARTYGLELAFNPLMIRGLGYYTGNIFEVKQQGKSTVAAGGRYDKLVGRFMDKEIPAVGISFGLERLTEIASVKIDSPKALLISINQDAETIKLTKRMRKEGISCIPFFGKTGKALEYGNSIEIPYVLFIGAAEIKNKKFKLKNMKTGEEKELSEKYIAKLLSKL